MGLLTSQVGRELGGGKGSWGEAEEGEAAPQGQGQAHSPPPRAPGHLSDSGMKTDMVSSSFHSPDFLCGPEQITYGCYVFTSETWRTPLSHMAIR